MSSSKEKYKIITDRKRRKFLVRTDYIEYNKDAVLANNLLTQEQVDQVIQLRQEVRDMSQNDYIWPTFPDFLIDKINN